MKTCETGPTVYLPYPRGLESVTICRCHYKGSTLKELRHGLRNLKSLAFSFQIRRLQSALIFSVLCHPCSFKVYHYLFDVFLSY